MAAFEGEKVAEARHNYSRFRNDRLRYNLYDHGREPYPRYCHILSLPEILGKEKGFDALVEFPICHSLHKKPAGRPGKGLAPLFDDGGWR